VSTLRVSPTIRREMTAAERAECRAMAADVTVYIWAEPRYACRLVRSAIGGDELQHYKVAETVDHPDAMTAFRQARSMVEYRERRLGLSA
jgi:hypothetical protein